jgi:predicted NUDIX family phosphoesterase
MSEQVLVIPASALDRLGSFTGLRRGADLLSRLLDSPGLEFRPRADVESDPSVKQLIPYVVFRWTDRLFNYTRGSASTESRLRALRSIGVGGHINPVDAGAADPYRAGLRRELAEEVVIDSPFRGSVLGLVYDPSTPVGQVHLGVVHVLDLDRPAVRAREAALTHAGFAPINELYSERAAFESWSQFALEALADNRQRLAREVDCLG